MKRCRSLKPCGSMSVDSIFFSTGIGRGASVDGGAVWPPLDERRLTVSARQSKSATPRRPPVQDGGFEQA
jgi:hypothetical protein